MYSELSSTGGNLMDLSRGEMLLLRDSLKRTATMEPGALSEMQKKDITRLISAMEQLCKSKNDKL